MASAASRASCSPPSSRSRSARAAVARRSRRRAPARARHPRHARVGRDARGGARRGRRRRRRRGAARRRPADAGRAAAVAPLRVRPRGGHLARRTTRTATTASSSSARDGFKLSDATELEIEARLEEPRRAAAPRIGRIARAARHRTRTTCARCTSASATLDLAGVRRRCSTAPTAPRYRVAPEIFRRLGAQVTVVADEPDGRNINDGCGSTHVDALAAPMRDGGHDVGFAFDGDGDRVLAVDRNGVVVDGDELIALAALHLRARRPPAGRRRRGDRDDELRLPHRDARRRHRGRDHAGRRPLRARGAARARLGARRRAVRPHHRARLRPAPATGSPRRC